MSENPGENRMIIEQLQSEFMDHALFYVLAGFFLAVFLAMPIFAIIAHRLGYRHVCMECNADIRTHGKVVDLDSGYIVCTNCGINRWEWQKLNVNITKAKHVELKNLSKSVQASVHEMLKLADEILSDEEYVVSQGGEDALILIEVLLPADEVYVP